jgi:hypothetical protein
MYAWEKNGWKTKDGGDVLTFIIFEMERAREYKENPGKGGSTQRQEKASTKD